MVKACNIYGMFEITGQKIQVTHSWPWTFYLLASGEQKGYCYMLIGQIHFTSLQYTYICIYQLLQIITCALKLVQRNSVLKKKNKVAGEHKELQVGSYQCL